MQLNYFPMQPKMNSIRPGSDFYLERVGFEAKLNMRRNLKNGDNLVGRSDQANVDISVDSQNCSRRHCVIKVSGNSVVVKSLNESNGTTVNRMKINKDELVKVQENDTIGIFGGSRTISELVGNYTYIVYRLCKYSNENLPTFEIDDDETIEIEDSDNENQYVAQESVNSNLEQEMCIELSRNFNLELKQELRDIDELEEYCRNVKCEPTDYFGVHGLSEDTIESVMESIPYADDTTFINNDSCLNLNENRTELDNYSSLHPRTDSSNVYGLSEDTIESVLEAIPYADDTILITNDSSLNLNENRPELDNYSSLHPRTDSSNVDAGQPCCSKDVRSEYFLNSDDSNDTVRFAPTSRKEIYVSSNEVSNNGYTEMDDISINGPVETAVEEVLNNGHAEIVPDVVMSNQYADRDLDEDNEETCSNSIDPDINVNDKLKETVTKLNDKAKKIRGPPIINAKPLEKGRKTKSEEQPGSHKSRSHKSGSHKSGSHKSVSRKSDSQTQSIAKKDRNEKLKTIAAKKTKGSVENKDKKKTNVKVKVTANNRGAFLTDATQMPILPGQKKTPLKRINSNEIAVGTTAELDKQTLNGKSVVSPVKRKNSDDIVDTPAELDKQITENMATISMSNVRRQRQSLEEISASAPLKRRKKNVNAIVPESVVPASVIPRHVTFSTEPPKTFTFVPYIRLEEMPVPTEPNLPIDPTEAVILSLPPETGTVKILEREPPHPNLKSILKKPIKKCNFQIDPGHEIISNVTLYDPEDINKANGFNRQIEFPTQPFVDIYDDCDSYQNTLVPLMKVELRREIEMEFAHSKNAHEPVTVQVTFQNVEKRGNGQRIIFHCQAESLYKKKLLYDGHLVLVSCEINEKKVEFLAHVIKMQYAPNLAFFEMETARFTEKITVKSLDIRPITVITNILNSFRAVHNIRNSPLLQLLLNPLCSQLPSLPSKNINYKGYENLDQHQLNILKSIYRRCIHLAEPSISLLNGAAGTGKATMIVNLVQQLTFGDELPKPLYILICSKSNKNIDKIVLKLIALRDKAQTNTRVRVVRFGLLENMDSAVRCVSTQSLKETETGFSEFVKIESLEEDKNTLELKIRALSLDEQDHREKIRHLKSNIIRINTLLERLKSLGQFKLRDKTTVILNSFNVICTTLASIPKLLQCVNHFDVCIINEASQCNEPLTLLPFQFGMPSLVLVGDSQLVPLSPYSTQLKLKNYGKSLFSRFQKLYLGKLPSPVFELNFQYRSHPEILKWPNSQFYMNHLVSHPSTIDNSFPIVPYRVISFNSRADINEIDYVMLLMDILLKHVNHDIHSIGVICTNTLQNDVMRDRLRDMSFISSNTAESYLCEKDVIIIWISKEFGLLNLINRQLLNIAVTRAKKCLIICGANLTDTKYYPIWKSLLDNAVHRKCLHHMKSIDDDTSKLKLEKILIKL